MSKVREEVWYNKNSEELYLIIISSKEWLSEDKEWIKITIL